MTEYLTYSLKVAALMAVFYLFWRLLLERETLHRLNRMVLLLTALGSFVLPLCVITLHRTEEVAVPAAGAVGMEHWMVGGVVDEPTLWERWSGVAGALLLVVTAVMLLHLIYNIVRLQRFITACELHERADGVRIAVSDEPIAPSSWMHTIMLSRNDYAELSPAMLAHERSHIRHRHSWDVLLVELVTALQWFNPVVWMIRQDLRTVHEYEADAAVIGGGTDIRAYFNMLVQKATGRGAYSMANGISNSTLKKRIKRMLKRKSNRWHGVKALYVIPVVALSLAATAKTIVEYRQVPAPEKVQAVEPVVQPVASVGNNQPLVFVDGKEVSQEMLKSLNPEQIEAMTVLKDKEATALYGERGKNGVILVTLKKEQQPASESDISLVFIDGKEVSREKLKHLDSEQIETVTVLKDKESTAAYGEKGKNGVMLITLKKEQQPDASNAPVAKLPQGQDPVYEVCEVLPEFPGGMSEMMKFVQENMKYPQEAHANGVQGRVIVNYIVEKDGSLSNIHVVRSVDPLLDAEALRVVSLMPKWKPGKQDGKPVRVKFTIPITFKLQG